MSSSGAGVSRLCGMPMEDLPLVSRCLMLDPITMGEQKYTRSGELRRILDISFGNTLEENSFGAAHSRPLPLVAVEELKRYKESILDVNNKARGRAKKLDERLHKLNKYSEGINPNKQQRDDVPTNERSGGLNLKMGTQVHRNYQDLVTQREEDRATNVVPNKRVDWRGSGLARKPLVMEKDRDKLKARSPGSDLVEEKIHILAEGGEGWDKRMKRKRSVATTFTRPVDSAGEVKQPMQKKGSNESGFQPCVAHGFRSGSSNGVSGTSKLDGSSLPAISVACSTPKHEQEKATRMRNFTVGSKKEKLLGKGNMINSREVHDNVGPSPVRKGKTSREPQSGCVAASNSSPRISSISGESESWEQSSSGKMTHLVGGENNRKHVMPSESSSPPMAQWVGQRPQKNSRTRRANLVFPVSNHEEMPISSEKHSPDLGARINCTETNSSHLFNDMANGTQQLKGKLENVSGPARVPECREFSAGENRMMEKVMCNGEVGGKAVNAFQKAGRSVYVTENNILLVKEEFFRGVQKQGRSGRGPLSSIARTPPVKEKLDNTARTTSFQSTRPVSDTSESNTGRRFKRVLDHKGFSRRGHILNSGSPDLTGESDDDRDELFAAANSTRNGRYHACSSSFWKKMEPLFASVILPERSHFRQQGDLVLEEITAFQTVGTEEIGRSVQDRSKSQNSTVMVEFDDQFREFDTLCGTFGSDRRANKVIPLYQRVLSALIVEDEVENVEENSMGRYAFRQCALDDICCKTEPRKRGRMEFEYEPTLGAQTQKQFAGNRSFSCNGINTMVRNPAIQNTMPSDKLLEVESELVHSEVGALTGPSSIDIEGPQFVQTNHFGIASFENQYEKMSMEDKLLLELQSIGMYLDTAPDLLDGENEVMDQENFQLKKELHKQSGKKKAWLDKVHRESHQVLEEEARQVEHVAMDRLVELTYKKLLGTRGSIASKCGIRKVSKQVALAFAKRTLARCEAFEESGISCFTEPAIRDVLFAASSQGNESEPLTCDSLEVGSFQGSAERHDDHRGSLVAFEKGGHQNHQAFDKKGPILNREKKEVLLNDVGVGASWRPTSNLGSTLLGGAKGRRSERERGKDVSSRDNVAKAGRPSLSNSRGERKLKSKPKQKTSQLSTSGDGHGNKLRQRTSSIYPSATGSGNLDAHGSNRKREVGSMPTGTMVQDSLEEPKETVDFTDFESLDTDLGGDKDFFSNVVEDDVDDSVGLAIPMDDIFGLFG